MRNKRETDRLWSIGRPHYITGGSVSSLSIWFKRKRKKEKRKKSWIEYQKRWRHQAPARNYTRPVGGTPKMVAFLLTISCFFLFLKFLCAYRLTSLSLSVYTPGAVFVVLFKKILFPGLEKESREMFRLSWKARIADGQQVQQFPSERRTGKIMKDGFIYWPVHRAVPAAFSAN